MWNRKELKTKAKKSIKKNYWTAMVICFLVTMLTGEFGTSIIGMWHSDDSLLPDYAITQNEMLIENEVSEEKTKQAQEKAKQVEEKKESLNDVQLKVFNTVKANINSIIKSQKFIYRIWDAIELISVEQTLSAIALIVIAIVTIIYILLIAEPLIVAERRYFIIARNNEDTKMGVMKEIFKRGSWKNVTITMLLKNIYTTLWFLTIIGGIIKIYEYRMIPYILAENPKENRKEVFKKSKKMMKGNKWKTFILDISFILWSILSIFTFGLLNILYINPYKVATSVELYEALKEE